MHLTAVTWDLEKNGIQDPLNRFIFYSAVIDVIMPFVAYISEISKVIYLVDVNKDLHTHKIYPSIELLLRKNTIY